MAPEDGNLFPRSVNTTVAWPRATQVQQPLMSVVEFLSGRSSDTDAPFLAMLRQTFKEAGFVEGQNVAIEPRWANGDVSRLPELAAVTPVRLPVARLILVTRSWEIQQ